MMNLPDGASVRAFAILPLGMCLGLAACDGPGEVDVLPLPPLERPSAEARLGLPEVAGSWRFAGWEVIRGDSTALERTFPSFGELVLETQRLDSIAGRFALAGGLVGVVGEVRRDGTVALVTHQNGQPGAFITGQHDRDTLWLELTSILPADEWPRDARAAFVQEPVQSSIAWLRGDHPAFRAPEVVDSVPAFDLEAELPAGEPEPALPAAPRTTPPATTPGLPPATGPAAPAPRPEPQPAPAPAPGPAQAPAPDPTPEPQPEPEPEPEPEPPARPSGPRLLGEPVTPPS